MTLGGLNFFLDSLSYSRPYILQYRYHGIYLILGLSEAVLSPLSSELNGVVLFLQTDHLPAELGAACSQCLHLDATYQVLQRELLSMKGWQRKCEKLEKENKKLEQEVVKLRSHMELKMIEHPQVEQYKREIEERVRRDLVEKWKEVNLFLQVNLLICHVLEFTSV